MTRQEKIRFVSVMAIVACGLLLTYREDVLGRVLAPLTSFTIWITIKLLHISGMEAVQVATQIHHPGGFAYEIYYRCTGFLPVAILISAIFAYPRTLRNKFFGLAVGVPVLIALNLLRLLCLFYVGVYNPSVFHFAHSVLWESLMIMTTSILWLAWIKWSRSDNYERWMKSRTLEDGV